MNASKFGRFEDEMIGLPNDISIKSRSISFPLGSMYINYICYQTNDLTLQLVSCTKDIQYFF